MDVKEILDKVAGWPEADREKLAALAREIEARRAGIYVLSDEERAAAADARRAAVAPDRGVIAPGKRHGSA